MFANLPAELLLKILLYLKNYSTLTLINSTFHSLCQPLLHQKYYKSRIIGYIKRPIPYFEKLCAGLLSCIYQPEWDLGALRLFVIDFEKLVKILKTNPNPNNGFGAASACYLDYHDLLVDDCSNFSSSGKHENEKFLCNGDYNNEGSSNDREDNSLVNTHASILRYSERMDLGTFLVKTRINNQHILLRCKPVGYSKPSRLYGDGRLVVWDQDGFGKCQGCGSNLSRLQVCEACKVVYYCSVECQKLDWGRGHRQVCEGMGFYITRTDELEL